MLKQTLLIVTAAALATVVFAAQSQPVTAAPARAAPRAQQRPEPRPAQSPTARPAEAAVPREQLPAPARQPEPPGQVVNVKLDILITDEGSPGEPSRKTVSMVVADRSAGSIRTGGTLIPTDLGAQALTINVDASPTILRDGAIRVQFGLEYQPRPGADPKQPTAAPTRMSQVNERLAVIVQDGKPLVISQAADAASDRKITVELKATILK
jgi:hypothetical protein